MFPGLDLYYADPVRTTPNNGRLLNSIYDLERNLSVVWNHSKKVRHKSQPYYSSVAPYTWMRRSTATTAITTAPLSVWGRGGRTHLLLALVI